MMKKGLRRAMLNKNFPMVEECLPGRQNIRRGFCSTTTIRWPNNTMADQVDNYGGVSRW